MAGIDTFRTRRLRPRFFYTLAGLETSPRVHGRFEVGERVSGKAPAFQLPRVLPRR